MKLNSDPGLCFISRGSVRAMFWAGVTWAGRGEVGRHGGRLGRRREIRDDQARLQQSTEQPTLAGCTHGKYPDNNSLQSSPHWLDAPTVSTQTTTVYRAAHTGWMHPR